MKPVAAFLLRFPEMLLLPGSGQTYLAGAFSPDGQFFAAGGLGHRVEVWDAAAPGGVAWEVDTDGVGVVFLGYTPAGNLVVVRARNAFHFVPPHGDIASCWILPIRVNRAAISADGRVLVTAGSQVGMWAVGPEFREMNEIRLGPDDVAHSAAVSPDGSRVAVSRSDRDGAAVIELFEVDSGTFLHLFPTAGKRADKLLWSPDGAVLAGLVDGHLTAWDAATGSEVFGPLENSGRGPGTALAFDPQGAAILLGTVRGDVEEWRVPAWQCGPTYRWELGPIYALAIAPDGLRAAAAGHAGPLLWDRDA